MNPQDEFERYVIRSGVRCAPTVGDLRNGKNTKVYLCFTCNEETTHVWNDDTQRWECPNCKNK